MSRFSGCSRITAIDDSAFSVKYGSATNPATIAYDEVRQIGPAGLWAGAKAGLIAAVACGLVGLAILNWISALARS